MLTSRKWSGKTLADHRADRKAWLTEMLGLPATDPARYTWQLVEPGDQDHMPAGQRLLHVVADRMSGSRPSTKHGNEPKDSHPMIFRQLGRQRET